MGEGRGEKGGAALLNMDPATFHGHVMRIYKVLGVHCLDDALAEVFGKYGCPFGCLRRQTGGERVKAKRQFRPRHRHAARGAN